MSNVDVDALTDWIGRSDSRAEIIAPAPAAGLSACLDYDNPRALNGDPLPPCWHWMYFLDAVTTSGLGPDGHPRRGGFLPPVSLPRRMWAGSRLEFHAPLKIGDSARRESTITDIRHTQGRSGELLFVTLRHEIFADNTLAVREDQDIVYRESGSSSIPVVSAPAPAQWSRELVPTPPLLFRYSALTFNSHRIHYDREYAFKEEGYSSLVVQGPLTATLLLDLIYRELPAVELATFQFRARRPLFEGSRLTLQGRLEGREILLWTLDESGALAMEASAIQA